MMRLSQIIRDALRKISTPTVKEMPQHISEDEYFRLCENMAELVLMYDHMQSRLSNDECKGLANDFSNQVIRFLSLNKGCTVIGSESTFDSRLHVPVPFALVENGTPIKSVIRIGIAIGEHVLIPAKVKI